MTFKYFYHNAQQNMYIFTFITGRISCYIALSYIPSVGAGLPQFEELYK